MDEIAKNTQQTDGIPIWSTEFNLMDKAGPVARTWTHALFSSAMLYKMIDNPSVELISSHSFNGHKFGDVFYENDEFPYMQIDPGHSLATISGDLSANGHFLAMVNGAFASMTQLAPLNFDQVPVVSGLDADMADHPALVGYLLQNDRDQKILFTNFSSQELVIDLTTIPGTWGQASILTADPRQHILAEGDISRIHVSLDSQLTLPAYSLAVVMVPEPNLLLGDANNNNQVTGSDLIIVQQNFGNVDPNVPTDGLLLGDANDDGSHRLGSDHRAAELQ